MALVGKRLSILREAELVADEVHQVGGILAVMDREAGLQADLLGILAQQPGADRVEGAGPGQRVRHDAGLGAQHLRADALDAPAHLGRRAAREGHQQDAARIDAVDDQVGHPMRQGVGLARSRAGDDQQRRSRPPFSPTPCSTARRCSGFSLARWSRGIYEQPAVEGSTNQPCFLFCSRDSFRTDV